MMDIIAVLSNDFVTCIHAKGKRNNLVVYVYSNTYELIYDPYRPGQWLDWNGGTLTEAILYVISINQ